MSTVTTAAQAQPTATGVQLTAPGTVRRAAAAAARFARAVWYAGDGIDSDRYSATAVRRSTVQAHSYLGTAGFPRHF